jgi:hypothetical protein
MKKHKLLQTAVARKNRSLYHALVKRARRAAKILGLASIWVGPTRDLMNVTAAEAQVKALRAAKKVAKAR